MKKIITGIFMLFALTIKAQIISNAVSGNITTQNLVPTGTATAGSAVVIDCDANSQVIEFSISGTYTSGAANTLQGFIVQSSGDGIVWQNIPRFVRVVRNEVISNVPSAETGIYVVRKIGSKMRICCISGAVTGTATITMRNSAAIFPTDAAPARYIATNDQTSAVGTNFHFSMVGNNKTVVIIKKITWSDYNTTTNNSQKVIQYGKGTAFVGGTSGALTTSRLNPNQLIEQSSAIGYSAAPTVTGNVIIGQFNSGAMITAATGSGYQTIIENLNYKIVGSSSVFYIQNRTGSTGTSSVCTVEWEEE